MDSRRPLESKQVSADTSETDGLVTDVSGVTLPDSGRQRRDPDPAILNLILC